MNCIIHFLLLLYMSNVSSSGIQAPEKNFLSLIRGFEDSKSKNNKVNFKPLKPFKRPVSDEDSEAILTEHPKEALIQLSQNNIKSVTGKGSYKYVMLNKNGLNNQSPSNKREKQRLKKKSRKPNDFPQAKVRKPLKEIVNHEDSDETSRNAIKDAWDEIVPLQQTLIKQFNNPGQYFKKPSKEFFLGRPNEIVFEIKPQYRGNDPNPDLGKKHRDDQDVVYAQDKAKVILRAKQLEEKLNDLELPSRVADFDEGKERFKMDGVLNKVQRRVADDSDDDSSSLSSSSSREIKKWKDEFREQYMKKKYEAINQTRPRGDVVNMVAARPWGVPCGDPNQHDMPWGTCTMDMECEAEYRIFRGDYLCGRTQFVCCAIQLTNYDMYQGFDVSFDSKSLSTDSDEKRDRDKDSKESSRKKKRRRRRKLRKARLKRKKRIRKNINKIIKEIRKLLDKQAKNGTKERKKKTSLLKKFVKKLKKQYKKDREAIRDIHEEEMIKIDAKLMKKLNQLKVMNQNFVKNDTFREIVVNGTINKTGARMLLEAYPDLEPYIPKILRRFGGDDHFGEYLDYDIEYGYLYY